MGSETSRPTIGFIGIGAMGLPISRCLIAAGFSLVAFDNRVEALRELNGNAAMARSSREVGDLSDIVLACLPDSASHRDALLGPDGLRASSRAHTYIHLGTTGSAMIDEIMVGLASRTVLDAPITGGVPKARDGTLTTIVSGNPEAVASCRPVFDAYSSDIVAVSDKSGMAQTMKLVNNIVSATNLAAACEAMLVGAKAGLDPALIVRVLNKGSGQNNATSTKIPRSVLPRRFDYGAALGIVLKDAGQFLAEAAAAGIDTPIAAATLAAYRRTAEQDGLLADMTAVLRPMERAAGFELAKSADET